MPRYFFIGCLCALTSPVGAQYLGANISAGIRKTFETSKHFSWEIRQQAQLNPEVSVYNNQYGDFFNEDGFWPIPDAADGEDDQEALNDAPRQIDFNWRSNTSAQFNFRFVNWLRSNAGYAVVYDGESLRHTFRAEADYRPCRHGKTKRKVDVATRIMVQRVGQIEDSTFAWDAFWIPRVDVEWTFKPNHVLFVSQSCNGVLGVNDPLFDRYRINTGIKFTYRKMHRFTLNYQFQQRLGTSKGRTRGIGFGYEIRL